MNTVTLNMNNDWKEILNEELVKDYFLDLNKFIDSEYDSKTIFPPKDLVFSALNSCSFDKVKVVILGQDPYHDLDQAIGLSFAVKSGMRLPPSLKNIFKEIESDLGIEPLQDGDLSRYAKQGVLLLNSTLTVEAHRPASHKDKGWERFTDEIIKALSSKRENVVFILWGNFAKEKAVLIDTSRHLIIQSPHPSPFSARKGFFGSKPFSKANEYLKKRGLGEVDWR
jgi:uracil-DNA glycosylase